MLKKNNFDKGKIEGNKVELNEIIIIGIIELEKDKLKKKNNKFL